MLKIEDIIEVIKCSDKKGYEIVFPNNQVIWTVKRRTIVGLLLLIKYEYCSEADLAGANDRLQNIKSILSEKIDPSWVQDRYGDANKPFSELWTEEGFSCIHAEVMKGNRQYVLHPSDHKLLFNNNRKASRTQLSTQEKINILNKQKDLCNICGSRLEVNNHSAIHVFAKDRTKLEFDHRIPVDKGGKTTLNNIQALCHYCNKCKRQMCFICDLQECSESCALVNPEKNSVVLATGEDISGRITRV